MKKNQNIPEPLSSFLIYIESIQGKSKKTADEYFYDLRTFYRFLKLHYNMVPPNTEFDKIEIDDVSADTLKKVTQGDIYEYIYFLNRERGNSPSSRARKVSSIRSFFKYLCGKTDYIAENPTTNLESVKIQKRLPRYFTLDESVALLDIIDGKNRERDYCMITLFLNCGMRLSELVNINIFDIKDNTLVVNGKGNKERTIYLNEACIRAIDSYMEVRKKLPVSPLHKNALFISSRGLRISRRTVQYTVEKYVKMLGLDPHKYTTHKLRHTAATLMHQSGVDIRVLQEILGHEQLSTTEIYTHVSSKQLQDAVSQNPLSSVRQNKKDSA